MTQTFFIALSAIDSGSKAIVYLNDKSLEQIEEEVTQKMGDKYFIEDYSLGGCDIQENETLQTVYNIAKLQELHGSAMVAFLKQMFDYFGQNYQNELDFNYENENELDKFSEKFNSYYVGAYPNDQDDFAIWIHHENEFFFEGIRDMEKQFPYLSGYFDWVSFSQNLILNDELWLSAIPSSEWNSNPQGYTITHHVFRSMSQYSSDWNI